MYKNWYRSKHKAFTKYAKKYTDEGRKPIDKELARIVKYCHVVRVIAHTQVKKVGLGQKKAHVMEIQVNGGNTQQKVDFAKGMFERSGVWQSQSHMRIAKHAAKKRSLASRRHSKFWRRRPHLSSASAGVDFAATSDSRVVRHWQLVRA